MARGWRWRRRRGSAREAGVDGPLSAALDDGLDAVAPRLPLATLRDDLLICPDCDALHRRPSTGAIALEGADPELVPTGRHFACRRCNGPLGLTRHASFDLPLTLASTGLAMLAIAHLNPVLAIDLQGQERSTTLWSAAWTLYEENAWFMTVLVLLTTLVCPLVEMLAVCYVLLPLRLGRLWPGSALVLRAMQAVRPWVMVEVFMLGVLVALVKLAGLASVLPGVGLWAFGAVMLLVAAMASSFDHEHAWSTFEVLRRQPPAPGAADQRPANPATSARIS